LAKESKGSELDRFLLIEAPQIREGLGSTSPGWVMGAFVGKGDLRHSEDFEVKEWDLRTMRRDWRNGEECGPEYIAVIEGHLTVILGRPSADAGSIDEDRTIDVHREQRIILAPGVWRKLEASQDIKGLTVRSRKR
jgi:hypothetical protein